MARVIVHSGALGAVEELILCAGERVCIEDAGQKKSIPARDLVNGLTVVLDHGGQAVFHHVVLAEHKTIYAEGVACESMLLDIAELTGR